MMRTLGTTRMVVAGMVLAGGALGMFGDMKTAAINQAFPRVPRTDQEQQAHLQVRGAMFAVERGLSLVARGRSRDGDPCVPTAPITFSAQRPELC